MLNVFAVFLGGGIGAVVRYLSSLFVHNQLKMDFPIATFMVNIIGCFVMGYLYIHIIKNGNLNQTTKLALTVGFCGGLTTFSTFSLEAVRMIQNQQFIMALLYILSSVIIGMLAVLLGGYCARFL